jgi:hypothetical protein
MELINWDLEMVAISHKVLSNPANPVHHSDFAFISITDIISKDPFALKHGRPLQPSLVLQAPFNTHHSLLLLSVNANLNSDALFTTSGDKTAKLWAISGNPVLSLTFAGRENIVLSSAFSMDPAVPILVPHQGTKPLRPGTIAAGSASSRSWATKSPPSSSVSAITAPVNIFEFTFLTFAKNRAEFLGRFGRELVGPRRTRENHKSWKCSKEENSFGGIKANTKTLLFKNCIAR